jgi:hypothetical protein
LIIIFEKEFGVIIEKLKEIIFCLLIEEHVFVKTFKKRTYL